MDYYVMQGRREDALVDDVAGGDEKEGEGINYYTFWVSSSLVNANWMRLPPITRAQLNTSRRIKQFFTGNPFKTVGSHPAFEGQ